MSASRALVLRMFLICLLSLATAAVAPPGVFSTASGREAFADEARETDPPVCARCNAKGTTMACHRDAPDLHSRLLRALLLGSGVLLSALLGLSHAQLTLDLGPQRTLTGPDYRIVLPWGRSGRQSIS